MFSPIDQVPPSQREAVILARKRVLMKRRLAKAGVVFDNDLSQDSLVSIYKLAVRHGPN